MPLSSAERRRAARRAAERRRELSARFSVLRRDGDVQYITSHFERNEPKYSTKDVVKSMVLNSDLGLCAAFVGGAYSIFCFCTIRKAMERKSMRSEISIPGMY